jgi:hypothetical protein
MVSLLIGNVFNASHQVINVLKSTNMSAALQDELLAIGNTLSDFALADIAEKLLALGNRLYSVSQEHYYCTALAIPVSSYAISSLT